MSDALRAKGAGSRAGHWTDAYFDEERVVAIDGQNGTILDWPPDVAWPEGGGNARGHRSDSMSTQMQLTEAALVLGITEDEARQNSAEV